MKNFLKKKTNKLLVISTGHSEDHRNKSYFNKIMNFIIDKFLKQNEFTKQMSFILLKASDSCMLFFVIFYLSYPSVS